MVTPSSKPASPHCLSVSEEPIVRVPGMHLLRSGQWLAWVSLLLIVCYSLDSLPWGFVEGDTQSVRAQLIHPSPWKYVRTGLEYAGLIGLYGVWLWRTWRTPPAESALYGEGLTFVALLKVSCPFLVLSFFSYPTNTDVYAYLQSGTMFLRGDNPYLAGIGSCDSPLSPLIVWTQPSPYGPVGQLLFLGPALVVPSSVSAAVYAYKALCLGAHISNGLGVWKILSTYSRRGQVALAYLLCPFLLFEHVSQAHLDVFLVSSVIFLFGALRSRRFIVAAVSLWVGVFTKTLPLLWLPLLGLFLLRGRHWRAAFVLLAVPCVLVLLTLVVEPTGQVFVSTLNPGVKWQSAGSWHNLVEGMVEALLGVLPSVVTPARTHRGLTLISQLVFLCVYVQIVRRAVAAKASGAAQLLEGMAWSTLLLFLVATPWYQPWYATVLLPMVAFLVLWNPTQGTLTFICSSLVFAAGSASYYILAIPGSPPIFFWMVSVLTVVPAFLVLGRSYLHPRARHSQLSR